MDRRRWFFMAVAVVMACCGVANGHKQQDEDLLTEPEAKVQLEYKVMRTPQFDIDAFRAKLNDLGRFGWEFSGTAHLEKGQEEVAVLKRIKK